MRARPHLLWVDQHARTAVRSGRSQAFELGRGLVALGWRVTVAASDYEEESNRFSHRVMTTDHSMSVESVDDVEIAWHWSAPYLGGCWGRARNRLSFAHSLVRWKSSGWRFGVVAAPLRDAPAVLAAWRMARTHGARLVLDLRATSDFSLLRLLARGADRLLVHAADAHRVLAQPDVRPAQLVVLPEGASVGLSSAADVFHAALADAPEPATDRVEPSAPPAQAAGAESQASAWRRPSGSHAA